MTLRYQLYVIECRTPDGRLDFTGPQPESVFGRFAIHGITADLMGAKIYARVPDAVLRGEEIIIWPRLIDPRWTARKKTW